MSSRAATAYAAMDPPAGPEIEAGWGIDPARRSYQSARGGWEIRTPEGLPPTRFPSERHRPLGESSSAVDRTGRLNTIRSGHVFQGATVAGVRHAARVG